MVDRVGLLTGSRFWTDIWTIRRSMELLVDEAAAEGVDTLILRHGACYPPFDKDLGRRPYRSADYLVHLWINVYGLEYSAKVTLVEQERPADWDAPCRPACQQRTHRSRTVNHRVARGTSTYCPDAGKHRNTDMVLEEPRPDFGIAFHLDNSGGTAHCIRMMRNFGIPVETVEHAARSSV